MTIATNMAGRGTDIVLGGNPETMAWARLQDEYPTRLDVPRETWDDLVESIDHEYEMSVKGEEVRELGGLHVLGTERHDARRIDLQLRGRCGRQGDPGSSRFYLSLDDDLMRIFAGPWVKRILEMGGVKDDVPIESTMVSRRIDGAQKKREEYNFEARKNLLEYDEVMDEQRKRVYSFRQRILDGVSCREIILEMVRKEVELHLGSFLASGFGSDSFASFASSRLSTSLTGKAFRNVGIDEAQEIAHDEAQRNAESEILAEIDTSLPESVEDQSEWNWEALARFANTRWDLNLRDRDLKKVGRDRVDEFLIEKAHSAIESVDLSEGAPMLETDYGLRTALRWVEAKFGVSVDIEKVKEWENDQVINHVVDLATEKYDEKEAEYPVMAGMYQFATGSGQQSRIDREGLVDWAAKRFETEISLDDFRNRQRDEIRGLLVDCSLKHQKLALAKVKDLQHQIESIAASDNLPLGTGNGASQTLEQWFDEQLSHKLDLEKLQQLERESLEQNLESIVEDHYHPEMRRMERLVLLEIVDSAWKDHLLAMDHLRSAVSQRGMASLDPKVEYKREGMRMFEGLWNSIGERVTDLIFRMEQLNEDFVSNTWVETAAVHEEAQSTSDIARQQEDAIQGSGKSVVETIRNRGAKVGRNDPCVCGSGKKFKNCCMRKMS